MSLKNPLRAPFPKPFPVIPFISYGNKPQVITDAYAKIILLEL